MNNATPKQTLNGRIAGLYIGQDPSTFLTTRKPQVVVNFAGIEGDKHAGITMLSGGRTPNYPRGTEIRNDRQLSIVSIEDMESIAQELELPQILPEWLGANLMIQGIPSPGLLPPATRIYFAGGVTLVVTAENNPCTGPGRIIQEHYGQAGLEARFVKTAFHKRGFVAMVEKPGVLTDGEEFQVIIPEQVTYIIKQ